jgi:acetolactate synthase-1/2/3 large subunit
MGKKVHGGVIFGEMLKREGVDKVFTLCGEHIMPMLFGCKKAGIEVIDFRHEAAAVQAADAYARHTGRPAVVIATSGPGVLDCVCGIVECNKFSVPVVLIGGGAPITISDTGQLQDFDTYSIFKNSTLFARRVLQAERFPYYLSMAFRHAMSATPGPAYLECDMDTIFMRSVDEEAVVYPENYRVESQAYGDPELIEKAADLLASAKRPYLVIGNEAIWTGKGDDGAVKELVDYLQIPVFSECDARGFFADESKNPLFTTFFGSQEADVVLTLAALNDFLVTGLQPPHFAPDVKSIQVNPDITRIGYNKGATVGIVGGVAVVAKQLLEAVKRKTAPRTDQTWVKRATELNDEFFSPWVKAFHSEETGLMDPGRVAFETAKFIEEEGKDWTIISDGGDAAQWIQKAGKATFPHQIVYYGPLGTIGSGFGYVTGSWLATGKPVLFYVGDGSLGFYLAEFYTYVRLGIPVVCVVSNDNAWGMIKTASQICLEGDFKEGNDVAFELPTDKFNYEKYPLTWDGYGELVTDPKEIIPAIKRGYASGKPSIINCMTQSVASPEVQFFAEILKAGYGAE